MGGLRLNWWTNGIRLDVRIRPAGLALAALYALACWATRQISLDQFYLPAGIRVAALLLCPPRLWGYLILGEYAYFAQMRYPMIDRYGLPWVVLASACLIPAVALVVALHRRHLATCGEAWMLSIAAWAALATAVLKLGLAHLLWPTPPSDPILGTAIRYVLGDYIAIITVVPLALLWSRRSAGHDWSSWRQWPTLAPLAALLVLGSAAIWAGASSDPAKTSLQLLMALPAVVLTCMHGWRGAALAVPLLNMLISVGTPSSGLPGSFDERTFMTLQIVAVAGTALLALGSRISQHYHHHAHQDQAGRQAADFSRNAHIANEMDLRQRALALRRIADDIETSLGETADLLKLHGHHEPARRLLGTATSHSRQFRELTSMVYPAELEQLGLYLALQASGIHHAWDATDRLGRHQLQGDPCQLNLGLQLATYRTLAEAVSLLLNGERGQIQVRARCGRRGTQRGIVVTVGLLDRYRTLSDDTVALARRRLSARPIAYGGRVDFRGNRIRMLLLDSPAHAEQDTALPTRLAPHGLH